MRRRPSPSPWRRSSLRRYSSMREPVCAIQWRVNGGEGGIRARSSDSCEAPEEPSLRPSERNARDGGEGGVRPPVPVTRQDAFEAPPLRPLRYLSAEDATA